jgi:mono/diheme cytochrome c family protein/plastocyanin
MKETFARVFAILLLLGGSISIGFAWWFGRTDTITLHARMPEAGGWTPADLTVTAGQPLHLRLTSDDVMHSFAIGQSKQPAVDVKPGEMTDYTVTFDKPGTYTFYCTRWCGPNHWRMRGTITVTGETAEQLVTSPLYAELGLDIDAPREAQVLPLKKPSAQWGADLALVLSVYQSESYYRSHSPEQAWRDLSGDPELASYSDQQLWDAVAYIWQTNTSPEALEEARQLYAQNCAACHGEEGGGDGVFADDSSLSPGPSTMGGGESSHLPSGEGLGVRAGEMPSGHETVAPVDFIDPERMLSAAPALLQGKIIRGGMGTGMPMWGVIFTEEQIWALVSYLYTFQFEDIR